MKRCNNDGRGAISTQARVHKDEAKGNTTCRDGTRTIQTYVVCAAAVMSTQ